MDVMHPVCCGIDVHQKSIVCCILDGPLTSNEPKKYQTTFGTTTKELNAALDWLLEHQVTHVFLKVQDNIGFLFSISSQILI